MDNIVNKIGEIAGEIYHILKEGEKNMSGLKKPLKEKGYTDSLITMAIGWLARENKIDIYKQERQTIVKLIEK
ncbi:winged helix-turn-helix domain-containing protein [Methanococcus aeolicus]|uniref:Uncharacterized protein n=1 Tax=Methanococcus aeolicus (strain ATCC BAA-1280 / DSM 17508 / OCM 812 / Nankai-3) TaxID=419665 RepID=A6USY0_META3|nr:winged helix-turn-helix domain-containing protein [Methanococcus aeolicus]ABR55602.1 conserved hypothetical protein [Methanococcus aeolicus Nankai-3]UXM85101.1 winged helix-turn-helix domain-containing protein [Methanococcus aeolicus]